ncbi:MAG TPA: ATP-binding cassette domain-containing protein [Candidatus Udaeobacter sp.]|nr:ATP-binding cassette domain-containing protein [Candidatus Udaeobacter sp.]
MAGKHGQLSLPGGTASGHFAHLWRARSFAFVIAYLALTFFLARSSLAVQGLALVAAVFGILAISLDLVAGMLGLYSLGQGGFFAIGAYLTTIVAADTQVSVFWLLPVVLVVTGLSGAIIGAMSLRVSGLYFAITTFVFTLVLTVLATDLPITGGLQGLLGPAFPDLPEALAPLGTPVVWCVMLALLVAIGLVWNIRRSPLYPVLLAIRDAEPFAEAAGVRTGLVKVGVFGLSAAMAGSAGWLFSFLGVVSPGQFDWSVSLNILVMVLVGGINTTLGPIVGASFVTMFPAVVNIDPWLQEILYGALSIIAITVFPEGVVGLLKRQFAAVFKAPTAGREATGSSETSRADTASQQPETSREGGPAAEAIVECRGIGFSYGQGPKVLRNVDLVVKRGHIHGLIGPNGSGKSTLANIIAGRLRPQAGTTHVKGVLVDRLAPSERAGLGLRRTFQAAQLVRELPTSRNVLVGLYGRVPGLVRRAAVWTLLPSAARDSASMQFRAEQALREVGAGDWIDSRVGDVPHGIEQLTQLASVGVAAPEIIVLDEPATGLSISEVDHLARLLGQLKARGVTMIIIEHQTRFLFPLCDQVTVLNAGEVVLTGTADEVRANPVVRQIYLGE